MTALAKYGYRVHPCGNEFVVEVWPISGAWDLCVVLVPTTELPKIRKVYHGPPGNINVVAMVTTSDAGAPGLSGLVMRHRIDGNTSAYIQFSTLPTRFEFGDPKNLSALAFP